VPFNALPPPDGPAGIGVDDLEPRPTPVPPKSGKVWLQRAMVGESWARPAVPAHLGRGTPAHLKLVLARWYLENGPAGAPAAKRAASIIQSPADWGIVNGELVENGSDRLV